MKKNFILLNLLFSFCFLIPLAAQTEKPDALKLYRANKYKEAIVVCENELSLNPNNMDSYSVLCWSLLSNKQYQEAEQRAAEAHKINSYDIRIIEALGEAKYYLNKYNEALNMFQRYVANANEDAARMGRVYFLMGEIYVNQSKFEHADISYSMAVKIEPLMDFWWTRLGWARESLKNYKSAIEAYDNALKLNPSQYDANRGKARCSEKLS